jgi:tRNA threonylcarbamoyladenosine biosynthesis protein TsaB
VANILHIETATQVCSVALSVDGNISRLKESFDKNSHSTTITVFIDEIMKSAGMPFSALDAIAVSKGPGSFTGLRIGVSTAKGICYALDKPLIAVSTLQSMAAGMSIEMESQLIETPSQPYLLCPLIDARRMEVYNALFSPDLELFRDIRAEIIMESSFATELEKYQILFFGDGAEKCKPLLGVHPRAIFINDFHLSAAFMVGLAEKKFTLSEFEDVVYFEPYYLKDFIPGKPNVKGLIAKDDLA